MSIEYTVTLRFQLKEQLTLAGGYMVIDDDAVIKVEHDFSSKGEATAYISKTLLVFADENTEDDRAELTDISLSELETFTMRRRELFSLSVSFGTL